MTDFFQHGMANADRRVEPVDGARPAVELVGNSIELFLAVNRQIRDLGQLLSDQSIDILATASLSRALRVTEVGIDTRVGDQLRMPGHLLALVIRQRLTHRVR